MPQLNPGAALERIWLELGELGLDAQLEQDAVTFRCPASSRWRGSAHQWAGAGRISLTTDAEGRHTINALMEVGPGALLFSIVGLGIPWFFGRMEWQGVLDGLRDKYLNRLAPDRELVTSPG